MNTQTQLAHDPARYLDKRQKLVNALYHIWSSVIPEHQPTEDNFFGWLDVFGVDVAAAAIRRTSAKARTLRRQRCPMDGHDLEAYATATMKRMGRTMGHV
jgi:hypothetical protein